MSGKMDLERLAKFRSFLARMDEIDQDDPGIIGKVYRDTIDLLDDRDAWQSEAEDMEAAALNNAGTCEDLGRQLAAANARIERSRARFDDLARAVLGDSHEANAPAAQVLPAALAEARRFRSENDRLRARLDRCPVEESDIAQGRVTVAKARAWFEREGWAEDPSGRFTLDGLLTTVRHDPVLPITIRIAANGSGRSQRAVLEEMAAIEVSP